MKKSGKIALGSVFCAMSLVVMLLTVIPTMTYALPALAGVVLVPVVLEIGRKWGWACYAVVSLLSLLLVPEWECKILFVLFFGYYPVLKASLERIPQRAVEWLAKIGCFNAGIILSYVLLITLFSLPTNSFEVFGVNLPWVFLAAGNIIFIIYDVALNGLIAMYWRRIHPVIGRIFH